MSKATAWVSDRLGIPEEFLNNFGAMLLQMLPKKTQERIRDGEQAIRALEGILKGEITVTVPEKNDAPDR